MWGCCFNKQLKDVVEKMSFGIHETEFKCHFYFTSFEALGEKKSVKISECSSLFLTWRK